MWFFGAGQWGWHIQTWESSRGHVHHVFWIYFGCILDQVGRLICGGVFHVRPLVFRRWKQKLSDVPGYFSDTQKIRIEYPMQMQGLNGKSESRCSSSAVALPAQGAHYKHRLSMIESWGVEYIARVLVKGALILQERWNTKGRYDKRSLQFVYPSSLFKLKKYLNWDLLSNLSKAEDWVSI